MGVEKTPKSAWKPTPTHTKTPPYVSRRKGIASTKPPTLTSRPTHRRYRACSSAFDFTTFLARRPKSTLARGSRATVPVVPPTSGGSLNKCCCFARSAAVLFDAAAALRIGLARWVFLVEWDSTGYLEESNCWKFRNVP